MRVKIDTPLSIDELCRATGGVTCSDLNLDHQIDVICTDTRECMPGDLFIALDGENGSGEKYINEALKKHCTVISRSKVPAGIYVADTVDALLSIAGRYKSKISPKCTVAVTGSVGKSTTVRFISRILNEKYKVHSTIGNFNNHIGLPLTMLSMPRDTEVLVTELGMNHKGEISRLSKALKPDIGVITSIGTAHIGNLGSRSDIASAKLELIDGMNRPCILLPFAEPLLSGIVGGSYVGLNSSLADFSLDEYGGKYTMRSRCGNIEGIDFFDKREHLLFDLSLAVSVALMLGMTDKEILKGILAITKDDLRQRFIQLGSFSIFDDSYNASLESVNADLKFIASLNSPTGAFLGDILELGEEAAKIHGKIGKTAAELKIGKLYLYGEYAEYTARGALMCGMDPKNIFINTDISSPQVSVRHIKENHTPGEIILFKASHKLRLDKIADQMKDEEEIYDASK